MNSVTHELIKGLPACDVMLQGILGNASVRKDISLNKRLSIVTKIAAGSTRQCISTLRAIRHMLGRSRKHTPEQLVVMIKASCKVVCDTMIASCVKHVDIVSMT